MTLNLNSNWENDALHYRHSYNDYYFLEKSLLKKCLENFQSWIIQQPTRTASLLRRNRSFLLLWMMEYRKYLWRNSRQRLKQMKCVSCLNCSKVSFTKIARLNTLLPFCSFVIPLILFWQSCLGKNSSSRNFILILFSLTFLKCLSRR